MTTDWIEGVGLVIAYLGGGSVVMIALSGWLGKLWADRLMKSQLHRHETAIETLKADFLRQADQHKTKLRKSEFLFQREYDAANALVAIVAELHSSHADPYMDDPEAFCQTLTGQFGNTRTKIAAFLARHAAILSDETRTLVRNAEAAAIQGEYGDIPGQTAVSCAVDMFDKLTRAETQIIASVRGQATVNG